jgi:hypothetical protein
MLRRSLAGAAAGTALVVSLTGCLGEPGNQPEGSSFGKVRLAAAQVLNLTSKKAQQVSTFKANLSVEMNSPQGKISMRGPVHYRLKPSYAFHMAVSEINMPGLPAPKGMHVMLIGNTTYIKSPDLARAFGGKQWLKIDLRKAAKGSGIDVDQMMPQLQQTDPIANTRMLTASKDAREVGEETVDGIRTRHFQGSYSMEEALAKLDPGQRDRVRKGLGESGLRTMNFDLWVDGNQLPRKLVLKSNGGGAAGQATVTVAYRDFGEPVRIAPPPASKVADIGELGNRVGAN